MDLKRLAASLLLLCLCARGRAAGDDERELFLDLSILGAITSPVVSIFTELLVRLLGSDLLIGRFLQQDASYTIFLPTNDAFTDWSQVGYLTRFISSDYNVS